MPFSNPINDIIKTRISCRSYENRPVAPAQLHSLEQFIQTSLKPPFGSAVRYIITAASDSTRQELKTLGTYGYIKGSPAFIIGVVRRGEKDLEDFGYTLEQIILSATDQALGTCWLGGTFTRSSFNQKIKTAKDEIFPAAVSLGYPALKPGVTSNLIRSAVGAQHRFPWEKLFFREVFGTPLQIQTAGEYAVPLEMLRLAPSASNKQPWRVLLQDNTFHFYLQRTPGYPGFLATTLLRIEDIQRVDMGIAMCHFELSAQEQGLNGQWIMAQPDQECPQHTQYCASWVLK